MSTQVQVFLDDTYRTELTTTVVEAGVSEDGAWIRPADNIFHPQGGGQPADSGTVNGLGVTPVWSQTLPGQVELRLDVELTAGQEVALSVDAEKRKLYAALHTAGHLLDAAIRAHGFTHIVSNHFPDVARIEFRADGESEDLEQLRLDVVETVAAAIRDDAKVTTSIAEDGTRTVTIGNWSTDVCGGTHVSSTSDIVNFAVRSVKVKKGRLKVGYSAEHRVD